MVTPIAAHTLAVRPLVVPAHLPHRDRADGRLGGRPAGLVRRPDRHHARAGRERGRAPRRPPGLPHPAGRRRVLRPDAAEAALGGSVGRRECDARGWPQVASLPHDRRAPVRDLATIADVTLQLGARASTCSPARPAPASPCWWTPSRCCWASAPPAAACGPAPPRPSSKARSRASTRPPAGGSRRSASTSRTAG